MRSIATALCALSLLLGASPALAQNAAPPAAAGEEKAEKVEKDKAEKDKAEKDKAKKAEKKAEKEADKKAKKKEADKKAKAKAKDAKDEAKRSPVLEKTCTACQDCETKIKLEADKRAAGCREHAIKTCSGREACKDELEECAELDWRSDRSPWPAALLECQTLCTRQDFEREWHHAYVGALGQVTGSMRGYNEHGVSLIGQIGFDYVAFEAGAAYTQVKIQGLPADDGFAPAWGADGRAIFYGNDRHRVGFFIGVGATHVDRDQIRFTCGSIEVPCRDDETLGSTVSRPDPRIAWWIRAPFGIDVTIGALPDNPAVVFFGRAVMEPWIPVGALDDEVTIMFGVALGILVGDRNDHVPYAK